MILLLKLLLAWGIPDVPVSVQRAINMEKFSRDSIDLTPHPTRTSKQLSNQLSELAAYSSRLTQSVVEISRTPIALEQYDKVSELR